MENPDRGRREIEHTADWELEVWGPDMAALLEEAARGMYELMGVEISEESRRHREFEVVADDREQLLISFLEELLFRGAVASHIAILSNEVLGAVVSSALFAVLHFVGAVRKYLSLTLLYLVMGLYLWMAANWFGGLATAMVAHALYDFAAIIFLSRAAAGAHPLTHSGPYGADSDPLLPGQP